MIEEGKEKSINTGVFGFQNRLRSFLMKTNNEILFCPLGGSGEIGANMNLYGFGEPNHHKWIIVDCGITFAEDSLPGIDVIIPDPDFIYQKKMIVLE